MNERDLNSLPDFAKWRHLLFVAESISKLPDDKLMSEMQELMHSLDEYFPRSLNPLSDFRAYATRQFCKSVSNAIYRVKKLPRPAEGQ